MSEDEIYREAMGFLEVVVERLSPTLRLVSRRNPDEGAKAITAIRGIIDWHEPGDRIADLQSGAAQAPATPPVLTSIPKPLFDYLVLKFVEAKSGDRPDKNDIFKALEGLDFASLGFQLGNKDAVRTRTTKLKDVGYLDWARNKKSVSVTITADGRNYASDLIGNGDHAVRREHLAWCVKNAWWIPSGPEESPT